MAVFQITAAASSGTGFSAALELDVDVMEKEFASYKESSVGSNLSASNISIKSGNATTVRGSQLDANDVQIDSQALNILASQDVNTSSDSSEHKNINVSIGIGSAGATSGSVSADSSQSNNKNVVHTNAGINSGNITINTQGKTTVAGANIQASDALNLQTGSLDVSSVQDSDTSRSTSQGISVSSGGSGSVNGAVSRSSNKETVLTSITGGEVNIGVDGATTIKGATIAAVDAEGNDNGNLSLETDTLEVSSLNNTKDSKAMSASVSGGGTVSVDASADNSHSKTKTLATLGNGNVDVADKENSDIAMLNRDIADNEVDIYDIESHKGLKGSLDTRLLTESGRDQIAEDVMKSGMIANTIKLIATTDKIGVEDFFKETDKSNKTYEAVKEKVAKDPTLAAKLQDPNLSPQDKEAMMNAVTDAVMVKLGYKAYENKIVATDEKGRDGKDVKGFYSTETKAAYINDKNIDDTEGLITTAGHEATRAMDNQDGVDFNENREDRTTYAENFGSNLGDYTDMALNINGYDDGMADNNNHVGNRSEYVTNNNKEFKGLDKDKGDNSLKAVVTAGKIAYKVSKITGKVTKAKLKKILKDEGLDMLEDFQTLADGELDMADALAMVDLLVGTDLNSKKTKVVGKGADATQAAERKARREAQRQAGVPTSKGNIGKKRDEKIPAKPYKGNDPNSKDKNYKQEFYEDSNGNTAVVSKHPADKQHPSPHVHVATPKKVVNGQYGQKKNGSVEYKSESTTVNINGVN